MSQLITVSYARDGVYDAQDISETIGQFFYKSVKCMNTMSAGRSYRGMWWKKDKSGLGVDVFGAGGLANS